MTNILIAEDEPNIASLMELELTHEGYRAVIAPDGRAALACFYQESWDVLLLDIMLPELNGLEVLRRIRKKSGVPVILVTARAEVLDRVTGLDAGADDYLVKPFAVEELLARIRSVLRRSPVNQRQEVFSFRELSVHTASMEVFLRGAPVFLTHTEFLLLHCLLAHKNTVLTRDQILSIVWGENHYIDENSVDVYIRYLRSKIDNDNEASYITTVRGAGYMIKEV